MSDLTIITSREDVFKEWDKKSVIIRQDDGFIFVYPLLARGVKYPDFDLRRECCLNNFVNVDQAVQWANSRNYEYVILR